MQNITKNSKWQNIPNILTIFRMILAPIIIVLLFIGSNTIYSYETIGLKNNVTATFFASGILFLIASISDFFDGYLARKYKWISDFGKIWDPIADKVLTTSIYISFCILNLIPFYFVILMIVRDIIVDAYRQSATKKGIIVAANIFGKLKTVTQMISIIMIYFVFNNIENPAYISLNVPFYLVQNLFVILATICSLFSGFIYIYQIQKTLKTKE